MRRTKLQWDFKVQTDHLISARRPNLVKINLKKILKNGKRELTELCTLLSWLTTEYNWKKVKRKISTSTLLGNWKTVEHESDGGTNCNRGSWYSHQRIHTGTGGLGNNRPSGEQSNYSIVEISQNTEKSPGDLRRLAVTQTPVRNHRLKLVWKTLKCVK